MSESKENVCLGNQQKKPSQGTKRKYVVRSLREKRIHGNKRHNLGNQEKIYIDRELREKSLASEP